MKLNNIGRSQSIEWADCQQQAKENGMDIKRNEEVYTADEMLLGNAIAIFRRTDTVNPKEKLYAAYLKLFNFEMGDDFFVPTDFVGERDADGRLCLTIDMKTVKHETMERMPQFVAYEQGIREELA